MFYKEYLDSAKKQFLYYKKLGTDAMAQLSDEQIFDESRKEINNIAIIVKHLHGNMMSRWTHFLQEDGEKEWRDREGEFEMDVKSREALEQQWNEGWDCVLDALDSIQEEDYEKTIYIRNMGHSILEAVNRQLCHYAYHVGQMVYIAKEYQQENWQSLSIPRGGSQAYNAEKFSQEKRKEHFTDSMLNKKE